MLATFIALDMPTVLRPAFDHGALDPRTASLAVVVFLRGSGLASSAFGWLAAPQDLSLLAKTWRSTAQADTPLELVFKHITFPVGLQEYGHSPGPPEPQPGFGVMPADCVCLWGCLLYTSPSPRD